VFPVVLNYTVFSPNHVYRRWPEDISVATPNYKFVVSVGGKKINYKKILGRFPTSFFIRRKPLPVLVPTGGRPGGRPPCLLERVTA